MKKLVLSVIMIAIVFIANAGDKVIMKIDNPIEQVKRPKRKTFTGKVVTRADYVKTSNPKRLHWNRIHEKNNPEVNNVINKCPKRRNVVRLLSLEKKAGNPKGNFHKRMRFHKRVS